MNSIQKRVIVAALALLAVTVFFAPWVITEKNWKGAVLSVNSVSSPIFSSPHRQTLESDHIEVKIAWIPLGLTWTALLIVSGGLLALFSKPKSQTNYLAN